MALGALIVLTGILIGIDASAQGNDLLDAVGKGDLARVKVLIAAKADVNAKFEGGITLLMLASMKGETKIADELIGAGADVNARNENGDTALEAAVQFGQLTAMRALMPVPTQVQARESASNAPWRTRPLAVASHATQPLTHARQQPEAVKTSATRV